MDHGILRCRLCIGRAYSRLLVVLVWSHSPNIILRNVHLSNMSMDGVIKPNVHVSSDDSIYDTISSNKDTLIHFLILGCTNDSDSISSNKGKQFIPDLKRGACRRYIHTFCIPIQLLSVPPI